MLKGTVFHPMPVVGDGVVNIGSITPGWNVGGAVKRYGGILPNPSEDSFLWKFYR